MSGYLESDPLFIGLTRRPMFLGVSFMFAGLNGIVCILTFINTKSFVVIFLMIALHMLAYIICFKEPLFMELWLNKSGKFNKCSNKIYYGANSYYV